MVSAFFIKCVTVSNVKIVRRTGHASQTQWLK